MGETELKIFVVIINLILLVFIGGIIIFFLKYQQRKLISEKEKALLNQQHAQEMLHARLEVQQQTMQDIGREIHDNVGQLLTVASISAYQVAYDDVCPAVNDRISGVGQLIDRCLSELRSLSRNLTDEVAEMADLVSLIEGECERINELHVCLISCTCNDAGFTLSNVTKNFIHRIVQEFIQNSLKHAECANINIEFTYGNEGLRTRIRDDGKGFDVEAPASADSGIGLVNMRKRAELMGAEYAMQSAPGQGTTLEMFIPASQLKFN